MKNGSAYRDTAEYRPIPFFFINTTEKEFYSPGAAEKKMRELKESGYGGALLFNKPPTGFDQEGYLSSAWYEALENFCIAARKLDLVIWINDGWDYPPGDAGGRLFKEDPTLQQYHLEKMENGEILPVETPWGFPAFEEERSAELFHKYVYEDLAAHLGKYFGNPIAGIFSDADNRRISAFVLKDLKTHIYFPWSRSLPERFRKRYGYELLPHLKEIFECAPSRAAGDYWELVSELYQAWFASNFQWCKAHGLLYSFHTSDTGPIPSETCRRTSIFSEGEPLKLAGKCDFPGTDHELLALDGGTHYDDRLFVPRISKGGDLQYWQNPSFARTFYDVRAKLASSAAFLHGKKRTLCEAFAATNYEVTPNKLRRIAAWQIMQGINFFIPHAVHLKFFGSTKFFAPPEFLHAFPKEALKEFNDFLAKYSMIANQGEYRPILAILDPTPRMWKGGTPGNFFALCDKLDRMAVDYVITDEAHAHLFDIVIDPEKGEEIIFPEGFATFSGGEVAYYRRFLPNGESFFLISNIWREETLSGILTVGERRIPLELAPGEIAVIGGPWEEFRKPLAISRTAALPEKWNITWEEPQKISFTSSFEWENKAFISGLSLLLPGNGEGKVNDIPLENGRQIHLFDDLYMEYPLPGEKGHYKVEFEEVSFEVPAYLSGDFEVDYTTINDFHKLAYELYNLRIFSPEKELVTLSPRKNSVSTGSWAEQGHPFYSGKAIYKSQILLHEKMDLLELSFAGTLCEVTIDGKKVGAKALAPFLFPLEGLPAGSHLLEITISNTLGNQLEGARFPGGLLGGRFLQTEADKEI